MMSGSGASRLIMQRAFLFAVDTAGAQTHYSPVDPALIAFGQAAGTEQVSPDNPPAEQRTDY
jgi:hypothetical protein